MIHFCEGQLTSMDGLTIYYYSWSPEKPKAILQLAHGMSEKGLRYEETAKFFVERGFAVYINDHRGHGKTACGEYGYMGEGDVFLKMVRDMKLFHDILRENHPGLKTFLLGHSMGSLLSLRFAQIYPHLLSGLILSGTGSFDQVAGARLGKWMTGWTRRLWGDKVPSVQVNRLNNMIFNRKIKGIKKSGSWICSDREVVRQFVKGEDTGFVFSSSAYYYLFQGIVENFLPVNMKGIRKNLPLYLFSGLGDPLGNYGKGVETLAHYLREDLKMEEVTLKLYEGRHEMLNEYNKEEVHQDLLVWLEEESEKARMRP